MECHLMEEGEGVGCQQMVGEGGLGYPLMVEKEGAGCWLMVEREIVEHLLPPLLRLAPLHLPFHLPLSCYFHLLSYQSLTLH